MRTATHPFAGARRMKPTQKHRVAIWECLLGTVYARNAAGEIRYFDYDWDAARAWAGVDEEGADPRVFKAQSSLLGYTGPSRGQSCLFLKRS